MIDIILTLLAGGVVFFIVYLILRAVFKFGPVILQGVAEGICIAGYWIWSKLTKS